MIKQKHLTYLDKLRESGETNMYGAGAYVQSVFGLQKEEANKILLYWMNHFSHEGTILKGDINQKAH